MTALLLILGFVLAIIGAVAVAIFRPSIEGDGSTGAVLIVWGGWGLIALGVALAAWAAWRGLS